MSHSFGNTGIDIDGKLLENRCPENPISSLWASVDFLRCCPVMKLLTRSSSEIVYVCSLMQRRDIRS